MLSYKLMQCYNVLLRSSIVTNESSIGCSHSVVLCVLGKLPLKAFPYTQRGRQTEEGRGREDERKPNSCKLRVIGERERIVRNIRGRQRERSERDGKKRKRPREGA